MEKKKAVEQPLEPEKKTLEPEGIPTHDNGSVNMKAWHEQSMRRKDKERDS